MSRVTLNLTATTVLYEIQYTDTC